MENFIMRFIGSIFLVALLATLNGCAGGSYGKQAGQTCSVHEECGLGGLMCLGGICKAPWDENHVTNQPALANDAQTSLQEEKANELNGFYIKQVGMARLGQTTYLSTVRAEEAGTSRELTESHGEIADERRRKDEKELEKAEMLAKRVSVFGVYLGIDTLDDIRTKAQGLPDSVCNNSPNKYDQCIEVHYLDEIGAAGVFAPLGTPLGLYDKQSVVSADFMMGDKQLRGLFLDGVLIEIKLLDDFGHHKLPDPDDGPKLRKSFNVKYAKTKSVTKKRNDNGVTTTWLYETWREKSGSFTVEITESRRNVYDSSACSTLAIAVGGPMLENSLFLCRRGMQPPDYSLTYRDDKLLLPLLSELSKVAKENKESEIKNKQDKLNQF